jgi:hypothetical protein
MSAARVRALAVALLLTCATALAACGDGEGGSVDSAPIGWQTKTDATGVRFALPVPVTGPEETRRTGDGAVIASRSYAARAGDLTISVQVLTSPEDPGALTTQMPARRAPFTAIDQVQEQGDFEGRVLSNNRVDEAEQPTYDAHLELSSPDQKAIWWMRTRQFETFQLVTQVVAFVDADEQPPEKEAETAFDRLNATVEVPDTVE